MPSDVGVIVDTFHLWWEPGIADQVRRAGERIVSYQVSDWITPLPADTLLGPRHDGRRHIDFAAFTRSVASTGYAGDIEVEIFNAELWAQPPAEVVETMAQRYLDWLSRTWPETSRPKGGYGGSRSSISRSSRPEPSAAPPSHGA